jgi:hypothetical protein
VSLLLLFQSPVIAPPPPPPPPPWPGQFVRLPEELDDDEEVLVMFHKVTM